MPGAESEAIIRRCDQSKRIPPSWKWYCRDLLGMNWVIKIAEICWTWIELSKFFRLRSRSSSWLEQCSGAVHGTETGSPPRNWRCSCYRPCREHARVRASLPPGLNRLGIWPCTRSRNGLCPETSCCWNRRLRSQLLSHSVTRCSISWAPFCVSCTRKRRRVSNLRGLCIAGPRLCWKLTTRSDGGSAAGKKKWARSECLGLIMWGCLQSQGRKALYCGSFNVCWIIRLTENRHSKCYII